MATCAICDGPIGAGNETNEHVIPQAIGGRLVVKNFICRSCNSQTGDAWDATLVKQLHPLSLLFGIKRQRGEVPDLNIVTTEGEELTIQQAGGFRPSRPTIERTTTPDGERIQLKARSIAEARQMLQGLARTQPDLPITQLLADAVSTRTYPKGLVQHKLEFGGDAAGRSIVKSVMGLANHAGISQDKCGYVLVSTRN